jgi:hypothetical protein
VRRLAIPLGLIVLLAGACGSGGNKPRSKEEYGAEVGSVLRPLQNTILPGVIATSPAEGPWAVERLRNAEKSCREGAVKLAGLRPPDEAAAANSQLVDGLRRLADEVGRMRKGAERGNFLRLEQFKVQAASDPGFARIRSAVGQLIGLGYSSIVGQGP